MATRRSVVGGFGVVSEADSSTNSPSFAWSA
jgi:hypothetical protein